MFARTIAWLNRLFRLTFDNPEYEARFHQEFLQDNFFQNKITIFVGLFIYFTYIPVSALLTPEDLYTATVLIFTVPVPFSLLYLYLYTKTSLNPYREYLLFVYLVGISIAPIMMLYLSTEQYYNVYVYNLGLPIVAIFMGIGVSFSIAFLSSTLVIGLIALTFVYLDISFATSSHALLILVGLYLLSGIGSYSSERSMRMRYRMQFKERELIRQTITDGLTGLGNRRYLDSVLVDSLERARKEHKPISLLMADIDYFKRYNDTYGHQAGDEVLKAISAALSEHFHNYSDCIFRYGGEEFIVVLFGLGHDKAREKAEGLLRHVRALSIEHSTSDVASVVTISVGVASDASGALSAEAFIAEADTKLYEAKNSGRNRVA